MAWQFCDDGKLMWTSSPAFSLSQKGLAWPRCNCVACAWSEYNLSDWPLVMPHAMTLLPIARSAMPRFPCAGQTIAGKGHNNKEVHICGKVLSLIVRCWGSTEGLVWLWLSPPHVGVSLWLLHQCPPMVCAGIKLGSTPLGPFKGLFFGVIA